MVLRIGAVRGRAVGHRDEAGRSKALQTASKREHLIVRMREHREYARGRQSAVGRREEPVQQGMRFGKQRARHVGPSISHSG